MITTTIKYDGKVYKAIIKYLYCRDCDASLPSDRHEIGYCEKCWRPLTVGNSRIAHANMDATRKIDGERTGEERDE